MSAWNGVYEPYDESEELDEDDIFAEAEANCGSRRTHQCDHAGSEYCDWSCPLHDIVFPPKRARKSR